ncbi:putative periplasmic serine endoprotease DegP-like precursor [compost metagenome]
MNSFQRFIILLSLLLGHCISFASAQHFNHKPFQKRVQRVVEKVSPACVKISRYDNTGQKRFGTFSGVAISADGFVLTAAHATITGESYLIEFPGGKQYRGTALARIPAVDAAMIKIDSAGSQLPYCEMGWSYNLKVNQPCLSIAYPGSLSEIKSPVVRLGYITRLITPEGKMQTSCLMEPGDSGGPVFDLYGRVIGLHSKIERSLAVNLENPIDNYRKYWRLLKEQKDYPKDFFPDPEKIGTDLRQQIRQEPELTHLPITFAALIKAHRNTSVGISSKMGSVDLSAWGSVISLKNNSKDRYVLSKSSIVAEHPVLITSGLKSLPAVVVKRDPENDLVLLKAEGLDESIVLDNIKQNVFSKKDEGAFLISPSYMDSVRVGILGNDSAEIEVLSTPSLGVICEDQDSSIVKITGFRTSVFEKYGLKVNDVIDTLNGEQITSTRQLNFNIAAMKPGEEVAIGIKRANERLNIHGLVERAPKTMNKHLADEFEGGMSLRSEGFSPVFVQDGMVRPEECGGPVFDLNGNFRGINIARLSRTSTVALPADVIASFVLNALEGQSHLTINRNKI